MAFPLKHPPPAVQMRTALTASKLAGVAFDRAWLEALDAVLWPTNRAALATWREALRDPVVVEEFRGAYLDEPSSPWALLAGLSFEELAAGLHELEAA